MVKLQIGENIISLTAKEEDLFFELLDKNINFIGNSPTFYAIHNWLKEAGQDIPTVTIGDHQIPCMTIPKPKKETVEDPWNKSEKETNKDTFEKWSGDYGEKYPALRELLNKILNDDTEKGYYIAL